MPKAPHPARAAALKILNAVTAEGRMISDLTGQPWMMALAPADRARATRLAAETLRFMDRADRILKPMLRRMPPDDVRHILRLAVVEMGAMDGAPHGVVGDAVTAADANGRTRGYKGMVNAVLRRATEPAQNQWGKLPVPVLPKWLRAPLRDAYGNSGVQGLESAHMRGAPLDLTVKSEPEVWAEKLGGVVTPTGSVRLKEAGQVSALPGFEDGDWWVQDAAAALPVRILRPQAGERIADLCAAPGGKTMQLAAAGAEVVAVDSSEARLGRVRENLARTKLSADIQTCDVRELEGTFDAVLLDAPCSATGTIRRHPDLPHARDGAGISGLITLQGQLLDHALGLLAPGGRLVFCTCSLLPDEGEVQVEEALARHKTVRVDRAALDLPGVDPAWVTEEGGLRLRPDYWAKSGGMDGFYIACLRVS